MIALFLFQESRQIVKQVVTYNTTVTWITAVLVLAWLVVFLVQRYRRARSLRRPARAGTGRDLRKVRKIKDELTAAWLKKGASKKIHAIGIGKLDSGEPCIQIFINGSNEKMLEDPASGQIPASYKGVSLVLIAMPQASFLAGEDYFANFSADEYRSLIRGGQNVITGGISGANTNLTGECGTIGYFVRRKTVIPRRRKQVYLLSNSHVFADLRKEIVDEYDLILQPSPGESAATRPIGELTQFAHPKLENDTADANRVDAAIARLWTQQTHKPLIPMIGTVKGHVPKQDVEVGEPCRKFGRTTGYTGGKIFSICLDIWVKYDRTGQSSFFKDQFLIEPTRQAYDKFVEKGDSGSLLVDGGNYACGLIFAGANGNLKLTGETSEPQMQIAGTLNNFGVANPISDVLSRLGIEFDL